MSTDDGCTLASSNGSMTMRPALSCSRIVLSDRITRGSLPARLGIFVAPRGCSSEAEHQLPKLRTRVRFPSPALRTYAVSAGRRPTRQQCDCARMFGYSHVFAASRGLAAAWYGHVGREAQREAGDAMQSVLEP